MATITSFFKQSGVRGKSSSAKHQHEGKSDFLHKSDNELPYPGQGESEILHDSASKSELPPGSDSTSEDDREAGGLNGVKKMRLVDRVDKYSTGMKVGLA